MLPDTSLSIQIIGPVWVSEIAMEFYIWEVLTECLLASRNIKEKGYAGNCNTCIWTEETFANFRIHFQSKVSLCKTLWNTSNKNLK
jgi:hypothetical protein